MTKSSAGNANHKMVDTFTVERAPGLTDDEQLTAIAMSSVVRNSAVAKSHVMPGFTGQPPKIQATVNILTATCEQVREGNLDKLTDMLVAQAVTLDTIFTEYSRRSLLNAGEYISAAEIYARLAARAQANCRATIEALAKIKRGGNQTVKVVHVHEGGQAVVADTINQGGVDGKRSEQPHARAGDAPQPSLSSPDQESNRVPVPGNGKRKVPHARRQEPRSV